MELNTHTAAYYREKEYKGNTAQKKVPNTAECDIIKLWINK